MLTGCGGLIQAGQQAGPLGPGPHQRLVPAGQDWNHGRHVGDRRGGGTGLGGEQGLGAGSGVLVIIQQPPGGLLPVIVQVETAGQGPGVFADQVMHPVPARRRLGQQVLVI